MTILFMNLNEIKKYPFHFSGLIVIFGWKRVNKMIKLIITLSQHLPSHSRCACEEMEMNGNVRGDEHKDVI